MHRLHALEETNAQLQEQLRVAGEGPSAAEMEALQQQLTQKCDELRVMQAQLEAQTASAARVAEQEQRKREPEEEPEGEKDGMISPQLQALYPVAQQLQVEQRSLKEATEAWNRELLSGLKEISSILPRMLDAQSAEYQSLMEKKVQLERHGIEQEDMNQELQKMIKTLKQALKENAGKLEELQEQLDMAEEQNLAQNALAEAAYADKRQVLGEMEVLKKELDSVRKGKEVQEVSQSEELEQCRLEGDSQKREIARLRQHLLDREDQITSEEAGRMQEMDELRTQNAQLAAALESSQSEGHSVNQQAEQQVTLLQGQLREKEHALSAAKLSVDNLQVVLKQLQEQREATIKKEVLRVEGVTLELREVLAAREEDLRQAEARIVTMTANVQELQELKAVSEKKDRELSVLKEAVARTKREFERRFQASLDQVEQRSLDRALVLQLLSQLHKAPESKRPEVLEMIARLLTLSEEEQQMVGLKRQAGPSWWGWFGADGIRREVPQVNQSLNSKQLSELWVQFLLDASQTEEATPLKEREKSLAADAGEDEGDEIDAERSAAAELAP